MKYLFLATAFFAPLLAGAASLSLTPQNLSLKPGEERSLSLSLSTGSTTIDSVEAQISFDPTQLEVVSFAFAPGWIVLTQPGYDEVDNQIGSLTKTAGYPGGVSGVVPLASLSVRAKAPGTARIVVAGSTLLLDEEGNNRFAGGAGAATLAISSARVAVGTSTASLRLVSRPAPATATAVPLVATSALALAAAAGAAPVATPWWGVLLLLALAAIAGVCIYRRSPLY